MGSILVEPIEQTKKTKQSNLLYCLKVKPINPKNSKQTIMKYLKQNYRLLEAESIRMFR
jgi:hypothetical protein